MEGDFCLGNWTVRPYRDCIECGADTIHLAPKAMAILQCLAAASNAVVSRQELFDTVWPGAVVSDDALSQRISELRKAFGDSPQDPAFIETIPKIGFRLIPPVVPLPEEAETLPVSWPTAKQKRRLKWAALIVLGVALLAIVQNRLSIVHESPNGSEQPSIAVLPFVNMSSNPENEYFAEGISEELLNLLAAVPGLNVISRSSSFSFKGKDVKIPEIARELSASLVLEGTIRKTEHRVRITAQLIEAQSDSHLWSGTYDREFSEIFALQEEIAQSILVAIQDEIGVQTVAVERPTEDIEAYELFLAGRHRFHQRGQALDAAILLLRSAVEKDPEFALAWAYLAASAGVAWGYATEINNEDARQLALEAANRALELEPGMGLALTVLAGDAWYYGGDLQKSFSLHDRAVEADPRDTTVRLALGIQHHLWGYLEQALPHLTYAQRHNPQVGATNACLGLLYLAQGDEERAQPYLDRGGELGWIHHYHARVAKSMMNGDYDEGFANLKFTLIGAGKDSGVLHWLDKLDKTGRTYLADPTDLEALTAVIDEAPFGNWEKTYLSLVFGLMDSFFEYFLLMAEKSNLWHALMRIVWLPEYQSFVEDPRFLEIMRGEGALALWEQRGFPDGCVLATNPAGDHLNCSERYR